MTKTWKGKLNHKMLHFKWFDLGFNTGFSCNVVKINLLFPNFPLLPFISKFSNQNKYPIGLTKKIMESIFNVSLTILEKIIENNENWISDWSILVCQGTKTKLKNDLSRMVLQWPKNEKRMLRRGNNPVNRLNFLRSEWNQRRSGSCSLRSDRSHNQNRRMWCTLCMMVNASIPSVPCDLLAPLHHHS